VEAGSRYGRVRSFALRFRLILPNGTIARHARQRERDQRFPASIHAFVTTSTGGVPYV